MKNILAYYFLVLFPILLIYWIGISERPILLAIAILLYWFPYRTIIDGTKLIMRGVIDPKNVWKLLLPGSTIGYSRELFFQS